MFKKAERKGLKARLALCGPTGSGKTYTALGIAVTLAEGGKVAVIDTERASADRYADKFDFDTCPLTSFSPEAYGEAIKDAAKNGYSALVIDSLSHAWDGADGMLERVDSIAKRSNSKNTFTAWGEGTPLHRRLIDQILDFPGHVIVTMRSKMEYIIEDNGKGKLAPRKVGMAPVQRQGVEYEFDIVGDMDQEHNIIITKSRAFDLADKVVNRPGKQFAETILKWAKGNSTPVPVTTATPPAEPAQKNQSLPPTKPVVEFNTKQPPSTPPAVEKTSQTGAEVAAQLKKIRVLAISEGAKTPDEIRQLIGGIVGREITSATDLTTEERETVISAFGQQKESANG